MSFQDQLIQERQKIRLARAKARAEWRKAVRWEGMDPGQAGTVVVFSDNNPFVASYETAARVYSNLLRPANV